jgi:diadenosine tetraphosphate (Ap4A) HIT family hydrolase
LVDQSRPFCSLAESDSWLFSEHAVAAPHAHPVSFGHAVVAPRRHVSAFFELDAFEQKMVWEAVRAIKRRVSEGLKVEGFHIGFMDHEDGEGHAHIHVIPRGVDEEFTLPEGVQWVSDKD